MMKQDMNGVRTAQDLERKYDLSSIGQIKKNYELQKETLTKVENELNNFVKATTKHLDDLQDQVDGNITTWFFNGVPTVDNSPANEWITEDDKINHLGDLYYDQDTGYAYRWAYENELYGWSKIVDADVVEALAVANAAQDTADKKRQVFIEQPLPPYDVGDLWIRNEELYRCQTSRPKDETFEDNDWIKATKYTDDTIANQVGENLTILSGTVTEIRQNVDELNTTITNTTKLVDEHGETIGVLELKQSETTQTVDEIKQTVSETTDAQDKKISEVTQTVEELNSKISDIADITTSQENNNGKVSFEKINESEPIRIVVRPIGENISYLYPSDNLYPSDDLFLKDRTIMFHNKTTGDYFPYELPDDLLYYDSEKYDEFILDYDGQSCVINKRVGYNADGTTYVLDNPTTIDYSYPKIELKDGDYEIELLGYDNAYLFVRLMAQNIYTTQFATRAEVNSKISQTSQEINLELEKKLDGEKFTGANIMLAINGDSSSATINADKISLEGKTIDLTADDMEIKSDDFSVTKDGEVTATSGKIGGYYINKTSFYANIKDKYTYTLDDYERARKILMGEVTPTEEDYEKLDLNKDGAINSADLVRILRKYRGLESTEGTVSINTEDANNIIVFEGNTDSIHTSIGMNKMTTDIMTVRSIGAETFSLGGYQQPLIMSGNSLPTTADNGVVFLLYED